MILDGKCKFERIIKANNTIDMAKGFILFAFILLTLGSCQSDKEYLESDKQLNSQNNKLNGTQLFITLPSNATGIGFVNKANEDLNRNSMFYDYFLNGGGVAVGDINNDGSPDIYLTGNDVNNKLYLNRAKSKIEFDDVTDIMGVGNDGWSTGVTMADVNNDGYLDIYVCRSGMHNNEGQKRNILYINNKGVSFTDEAKSYGLDDAGQSVQASFFDYDNDGDLDVWVSNHVNYNGDLNLLMQNMKKKHKERKQFRSSLYRNDNGKYIDVSQEAGVSRESASLGLVTTDINNDGWVDIYVSNDYDIPDYYFINNGDGTFREVSNTRLGHTSFYSMGIDAADINEDGNIDMVAVDMTPQDHIRNKVLMASMDVGKFNFLYDQMGFTRAYMYNAVQMGRGNGYFSEVGNFMGVSQTEWSWTPLIADFDNDGKKDLYITNGYYKDTKDNDFKRKVEEYKQSNGGEWNQEVYDYCTTILTSTPVVNRVFSFNGDRFIDNTDEWTEGTPTFSNGAAYGDFDLDGDLDIVINNLFQPVTLLENTSNNNSISILLTDTNDGGSNVLNSKVCITVMDEVQCVDYTFSRGYQSHVNPTAHFGIGDHVEIEKIEIFWNDGTYSLIESNDLNNLLLVNEIIKIDKSKVNVGEHKKTKKESIFKDVSKLYANNIGHKEMKFNDFEKEVLLPHKYSDLGPALAVGDINGDGIDDMFLGGSNTSESQLLIGSKSGFKPMYSATLLKDKKYEDLGALFFDYDNDGDLDLYVTSGGGGEISKHENLTSDRLYQNDGKGIFVSKHDILPLISSSTKVVRALDADNDGDLDLIVGGRNTPGKYPRKAKSYYLENNNGAFRNRTAKVINDLPDMITGIEVDDVNDDGWLDMIVVGEWSAPILYINTQGIFKSHELDAKKEMKGWWQSIKKIDIDGDGDNDFVLGNIGENNKFHPSQKKQLGLLASDFDDSGTLDIVLTKNYKDMTVPVRGKECSSVQMPMIKDKFPTYEGFASSSIEEILGADKIGKAIKKSVNNFASYIMINNGNLNFSYQKLPSTAQWSPIMDIAIDDYDFNGTLDMLIIGNKLNTEPETPSYDAGMGLILLNNGINHFNTVSNIELSGMLANKDARQISTVTINKEKLFVIANNNGPLQLFKLNQKK